MCIRDRLIIEEGPATAVGKIGNTILDAANFERERKNNFNYSILGQKSIILLGVWYKLYKLTQIGN